MIGAGQANVPTPPLCVGRATQTDARLPSASTHTRGNESIEFMIAVYDALEQTLNPWRGYVATTPSGVTAVEAGSLDDRRLAMVGLWFTLDVIAGNSQSRPSGATLSPEALAFCGRAMITNELSLAIDLARRCFPVVGTPSVSLLEDPEIDETEYLIIELQVRGTVKDNVLAHRKFASEAIRSLGAKREIIRLNYNII